MGVGLRPTAAPSWGPRASAPPAPNADSPQAPNPPLRQAESPGGDVGVLTQLLQQPWLAFGLPNAAASRDVTHGQVGKSDLELLRWLRPMLQTAAEPAIS